MPGAFPTPFLEIFSKNDTIILDMKIPDRTIRPPRLTAPDFSHFLKAKLCQGQLPRNKQVFNDTIDYN